MNEINLGDSVRASVQGSVYKGLDKYYIWNSVRNVIYYNIPGNRRHLINIIYLALTRD